ncbi:AAA family ATPase [bacterium]|nr:AAA family ATPase [bacterium]
MTVATLQLDKSQQEAIAFACDPSRRNAIITGGAGTGKTTIIEALTDRIGSAYVMAPTGKAAARLKEATGAPATTIHHVLKYDGARFNRQRDFRHPVIVDESSMVDSALLAAINRYNPPKLILVGDDAQLAPVGKGQPFHDLVALRPDLVHNLTHCHRASGAVHKAALAIRNGEAPSPDDKSGGESFKIMNTGGPESTATRLIDFIRQGFYDPTQDVILTCRNGKTENDDGGINHINYQIKQAVNPSLKGRLIDINDRVMIVKNFPQDDLWNGDMGTVTAIDHSGLLYVSLDRDPRNDRRLTKPQVKQTNLAYCLTVHKSQGSQFRRVFFLLFMSSHHMLSRSLIYTGVTRAKNPGGVVIMGEPKAFYAGINKVYRKTTVIQKLENQGV